MPALKNWEFATTEERSNFRHLLLECWHTLNSAIKVLTKGLDSTSLSNVEALGIESDISQMKKQRDLLDDYEDAFRYNRAVINPPSADQVNQAQRLTEQVQTLTNNSQAAGRALELVRQALELLRKVYHPA